MSMELKRPVFDDFLPGAACPASLRVQLRAYAKANNTSEGAVIRVALKIFLDANSTENASDNTARPTNTEGKTS
jgi:hypothetical protein